MIISLLLHLKGEKQVGQILFPLLNPKTLPEPEKWFRRLLAKYTT